MKIGVKFPQETIIDDVALARDFVRAAEELGYARLLIFEHVLGAEHANRSPSLPPAYDETSVFHEALVFLGFVAACTSSIELATGIIVSPQRQTALLAKQAAEVAILSNNRLVLGLGVGWNWVEFQGMGAEFSRRGARQEEQIEVLRRLWVDPIVEFHGEFHELDRVGIAPLPARPIPIWLGGFAEPVYRRAARMADGLITSLGRGISERGLPKFDAKAVVRHVRELVAAEGRNQEEFGVEVIATEKLSPGEFAEVAEDYREAGASHLTLLQIGDHDDPHQYIPMLEKYKTVFDG
jgi:probable F420-dependent oxidoreductase